MPKLPTPDELRARFTPDARLEADVLLQFARDLGPVGSKTRSVFLQSGITSETDVDDRVIVFRTMGVDLWQAAKRYLRRASDWQFVGITADQKDGKASYSILAYGKHDDSRTASFIDLSQVEVDEIIGAFIDRDTPQEARTTMEWLLLNFAAAFGQFYSLEMPYQDPYDGA